MATRETKVDQAEAKEELFPYMIPISKERQDDVPVTINGKTTVIQRGETVMVTAAVKEVLDNKFKMEKLALTRSLELQKKSDF